ncbi:MAG: hypothetical protein RIE53_03975 [Rhodothermales bacterium]
MNATSWYVEDIEAQVQSSIGLALHAIAEDDDIRAERALDSLSSFMSRQLYHNQERPQPVDWQNFEDSLHDIIGDGCANVFQWGV